jgi:ABC-2 type transport system permease protein
VSALAAAWREELHRLAHDEGALLVLVGAVLLYGLVYPLPYSRGVVTEVPIVVVDEDRSELSRRLARMADESPRLRVAGRATTIAQAEAQVAAGRAQGALVIPRGFERSLLTARGADVAALANAAYFLVYSQAMTGMVEAALTLGAGVEVRRLEALGVSEETALRLRDPVGFEERLLFNPTGGYAAYIVPAVLVLILQQTLLIGIGMLAGTARARGEQVARHGALAALVARVAVLVPLYLVHMLFYLAVVYGVYGFARPGGIGTILLFLLPFLLAVVFLGTAVSAFFRRRETSMQVLLFTSLPMIFVSGVSWPVEMIPSPLRVLGALLPSTAGIAGFLRVSQMGASLAQVRREWLLLWALAAAYALLAWLATQRAAHR